MSQLPKNIFDEQKPHSQLLLFLLLLSCIIALIRELVNIILSTTSKALSANIVDQIPTNIDIDIDVDISRRRSAPPFGNSTRESSILLNTSSILYYQKIKIQSNNPL